MYNMPAFSHFVQEPVYFSYQIVPDVFQVSHEKYTYPILLYVESFPYHGLI